LGETGMTLPSLGDLTQTRSAFASSAAGRGGIASDEQAGREFEPLRMLDEDEPAAERGDPGTVLLTCANCGAQMIERKCKLICRCGYFLSCSDYY
jgi:hypothetical protein